MKKTVTIIRALALITSLLFILPAFAAQDNAPVKRGAEVIQLVHHDVSRPLSEIPPSPRDAGVKRVRPNFEIPATDDASGPISGGHLDPAMQMSLGATAAPSSNSSFNGVGDDFTGPQGTWNVNVAPPDTVGDVGPSYIVQAVNSGFAVFDKSGTVLYGPVNINTVFSGFGGNCQKNNDGDPTVNYDQVNDRWIIAQFAVAKKPYLECVAVSKTSDPKGAYNRYSYSFSDFPDYPKLAVWSDGYYITYNMFTNISGYGKVCAHDGAKMRAGLANTMQCFNTATNAQGLLASEADGGAIQQPPAGRPNFVARFSNSNTSGADVLQTWKFKVDWTNSANSTFTGPTNIPVADFTPACISATRGACIPQLGSTTKLESLSSRLMNRFAYRNFGDHESLVVAHTVGGDTAGQIRWYELRSPNTTATVYQQATYAPTATEWRWMPSIAMDKVGDIAVGYSVAGSMKPNIYYTGQAVGDPLNTMGTEASLLSGVTTGAQKGTYSNPPKELQRWGDYSAMIVDPSDDCTFWFTTEYLPADGIFNWHTRLGSFKFPGCL